MSFFGRDLTATDTRRYYNPAPGAGTRRDKAATGTLQPVSVQSEANADALYRASWFLRDVVDIPIDDMFARWREFDGARADAMREAEDTYSVRDRLSEAIKSGRRYGSGLLVMVTREELLELPLVPEQVRRGDLVNLFVTNNYRASIADWQRDFGAADYGKPLLYGINLRDGRVLMVHASRVLRFDGIEPMGMSFEGPSAFGGSLMGYALDAALRDSAISSAITHLSQESSVATLKVKHLDERVSSHGFNASDDPTPSITELVEGFDEMRSVWRTNVIDADSDLTRTEVRWNGLSQVEAETWVRMAAIANIPATRLMGQSPVGMNATGESDLVNYALSVKSRQERDLSGPLDVLDEVVARSAYGGDPPDYQFLSLLDLSEQDKATAAATWATALATLTRDAILDEDEARDKLRDTNLFGDLSGPAPMPEIEPDEVIETVAVSEGNDAN